MKTQLTFLMPLLFLTLPLAAAEQTTGDSFLWWEGENPAETNLTPAKPQKGRAAEVLSGGQWLEDWSVTKEEGEVPFIEYDVDVPAAGSYDFYVRKFWKHGPFRWRFDEGDWQELRKDATTLLDYVQIQPKLGACWIPLGTVELSEGTHRLRVEIERGQGPACIDAWLLTRAPFIPRGKLKPDAPFPPAPEGWFNVEPQHDEFATSPIDLRYLNEPVAGSKGFIQSRDNQLIHADTAEPIRFWAVNAGNAVVAQPKHYVDQLARFLAKRGVNMVRLHGGLYHGSGKNAGTVNEEHLDAVFYFVKAMKDQGIYCHFSIHFQHWLNLSENPDFPGYADMENGRPYVVHYFSPQYQELYRSWWKALLSRENPYTGQTLAQDPAVAGAEILNEDSFFFWTFKPYDTVPAQQMAILEKRFHEWLIAKYASAEAIPWKDDLGKVKGDDLEQNRVGLYSAGLLTAEKWAVDSRNQPRAEDTTRFLAEVQRDFYADTTGFLRNDLGFKGFIVASNWKTADDPTLEPVEHWTYLPTGVIDHHGYFGGSYRRAHRSGGMLDAGDQYRETLMVRLGTDAEGSDGSPRSSLPFIDLVIDDKASMASEFTWIGFRPSRAEMPLFVAAQSSLTGMDAMVFFALGTGPGWDSQIDSKWPLKSPTDIGQFPAAAFLYRQGLVQTAEPSAEILFNIDEILALGGSPVVSSSVDDDNRTEEGRDVAEDGGQNRSDVLDPMLSAIGPVHVRYSQTEPTRVVQTADLSKYFDPEAGTLTTLTGEQTWRYKTGIYTVNTPQAQCVTGILEDAGTVELQDMTVTGDMPFASVMTVALDGKPIRESGKILVQVMSRMLNNGWKIKPVGDGWQEIVSTGQAPTILEEFSGTLTFDRPDAADLKVTALDLNGYPTDTWQDAASLDLRPNTIYYLIEKP